MIQFRAGLRIQGIGKNRRRQIDVVGKFYRSSMRPEQGAAATLLIQKPLHRERDGPSLVPARHWRSPSQSFRRDMPASSVRSGRSGVADTALARRAAMSLSSS